MRARWLSWMPAVVLGLGALFTAGTDTQRALPLRAPLVSSVPRSIVGHVGSDFELSERKQRVAGVTDHLMRFYEPADSFAGQSAFSVYIGYYDQQSQGKTIHSPKNCLPGSGWEALESRTVEISTFGSAAKVNRYLLQQGDDRALVLYWYQGRGRVQANEYVVKWDLLRDAALKGRSDEALVRVVVPVTDSVDAAFDLASKVAAVLIPALEAALPS